jgi:hypothetical protein
MAFDFKGEHFTDEMQSLIFKDCPRCKQIGRECNKSLDQFPQYSKGMRRGLPFHSYCRVCHNELTKARNARKLAIEK